MANTRQQQGRQSQLDDEKATRPTELTDVDGSSTDEITSSINIISTGEERRQRHQGSGDDNGMSTSDQSSDTAGAREGIDDERTLQDELRPKDGSIGVTADADVDENDEDAMPTGLPKKPGFEDYNPAARPHIQAGDSNPEVPA